MMTFHIHVQDRGGQDYVLCAQCHAVICVGMRHNESYCWNCGAQIIAEGFEPERKEVKSNVEVSK